MSLLFEGSEKKLEIVLADGQPSLRSWPEEAWREVVGAANARILSKISNEACDAYLLSESSLFVWDDTCLLITCGTTTLANAAKILVQKIGVANMDAFFFQRKNEYFPHLQHSDFYSDVKAILPILPGAAYRMGRADEHHVFLFHGTKTFRQEKLDPTLEVLMYDLQGKARDCFLKKKCTVQEIRSLSGVDRILPGFQIDDFAFDPYGYSLNAIKGSRYYTIHVTPQNESPYVSFETNVPETGQVVKAMTAILEVFAPKNFDVVFFDQEGREEVIDIPGYSKRSHVRHKFEGAFMVQFGHFTTGEAEVQKPVRLILD